MCCGSSRTSSSCGLCSGPQRLRALSAALVSSWPRTETPGALSGLEQASPSPPEASQALARACSSPSSTLLGPASPGLQCPALRHSCSEAFAKALHLAAYSCLSGGCVLLTSQRPVSGLLALLVCVPLWKGMHACVRACACTCVRKEQGEL